MRKQYLNVILAVLLICCSIAVLPSCFKSRKSQILPEYESGYFKYSVKTEKDGTKKAYLTGLTESGLEQTELIYPEEIDGITVYGIGYEIEAGIGSEYIGFVGSSPLQKFFFPTYQKENLCRSEVVRPKCSIYWNDDSDESISSKYTVSSRKYIWL